MPGRKVNHKRKRCAPACRQQCTPLLLFERITMDHVGKTGLMLSGWDVPRTEPVVRSRRFYAPPPLPSPGEAAVPPPPRRRAASRAALPTTRATLTLPVRLHSARFGPTRLHSAPIDSARLRSTRILDFASRSEPFASSGTPPTIAALISLFDGLCAYAEERSRNIERFEYIPRLFLFFSGRD